MLSKSENCSPVLMTLLGVVAVAAALAPHRPLVAPRSRPALLALRPDELRGTSSAPAEPDVRAAAAEVSKLLTPPPAAPPPPLEEPVFKLNTLIVDSVKGAIDLVYRDHDYARFFVLETVARVPYFAYLSVLHLRETFGARDPGYTDRMRTHYFEADNELHHLLIMESLGGNSSAVDRGVAQTMAFFYYWYVVAVFFASPQSAYHLSELIEDHAYETYDAFLTENAAELKTLPVPDVARQYYEQDCMIAHFDPACSVDGGAAPRESGPRLRSLYDVFVCVRNDEREHWETLCNLVQHGSLASADGRPAQSTQPRRPPES